MSIARAGHPVLCLALGGIVVAQSTPPPVTQEPQKSSTVEALRERIDQQRARLDEEGRRLEEMAAQLRALQRTDQGPTPAAEPQQPAVAEFREHDPADTKDDYAAEPNPLFGDFPGSFKVPGTQTSIQVGGFVKLNLVRNWNALGSDYQFVVPSIPVEGSTAAVKGPRTTLSARETRLHLDVRMPSGDSYLRAYIETDFAGSGSVGSDLLRLRHAFGQFDMVDDGYLLAGKTWSTFMDVGSLPDTIDFEGLVGAPFHRTALVRWSRPLADRFRFALSLEDPAADITGGYAVNEAPDLAASITYERDWGHVYLAAIGRTLKAERVLDSGSDQRAPAFGVTLSGKVTLPWGENRDALLFSATLGRGIGSYVTGSASEGGQDAAFDPNTGAFDSLPVLGMHAGIEHGLSDAIRLDLVYSFLDIDNLSYQPSDAFHQGHYLALNALWSITPDIVLGVEQLYGIRRDADGASGDATQTQIALKFTF